MNQSTKFALQISQLTKVYEDGFVALKGVDLDVAEGDFFALLGPNGAGKSTTIGIICSLVRKSEGSVTVFGQDIDTDFSAAKQYVGVVPQEFNFNQFEKPIDILINQAGYFGISAKVAAERAEKYLLQLGLWDKAHVPSRTLSGGMKRRLMIARALMHAPKLLVLDEPTAGVDIELRRSMWEFLQEINKQGTTIILTTHYLEEAESLCRNVAIIDHGQIVQNTSIRELISQLNKETFILDTREKLSGCPQIEGYPLKQVDTCTLEVEVEKSQSINELFAALTSQGLHVVSMRNKTNRLEELFFDLVAKNLQEKGNE
ncbi:ABC transporter ATP-binding protein [SAR92 clade bacterium H921]|nr:ABC transporter ATP-binding protein [SAR92 clade bacterium H921]MDG0971440.1 ABC transporter ATP-binding protein [Porticoccaceae bacterium]MDG1308849.1 ABC transporter ATP-binding protein [Porticoccaceae bacterium]